MHTGTNETIEIEKFNLATMGIVQVMVTISIKFMCGDGTNKKNETYVERVLNFSLSAGATLFPCIYYYYYQK